MDRSYRLPRIALREQPLFAMLAQFPAVAFTLALVTDIAFWQTSNILWQNFSSWLLFAGLVVGGLAAFAAVISLLFSSRFRFERGNWLYAAAGALVLALAFLNSLVHAADGWTAVVPYGLILSAATVLVMLVAAWIGHRTVARHGFGAQSYE